MKFIITTFLSFHSRPRGIKMMLLTSESHFFNELNLGTKMGRKMVSKMAHCPHENDTIQIQIVGC
jgi:hypothetical protein